MKLHIVMHESFEAPAAIEVWAKSKNHGITYIRLYQGDRLPCQVDAFDFLIVMGGPQSPATTIEQCPYFDAQKEIELIKMAINADKAILGVCLGAQLVGEALGAKFEHSPNREIGVFDLTLTEAGKISPPFLMFPEKFVVGHWHGDMPGLTSDAQILAYSEGCPRQIIKYGPKVWGFQCHFEFTPKAIEGMLENCSAELEKHKNLPYVQDAETLRNSNYDIMNDYLFQFLDHLESMQMNKNI